MLTPSQKGSESQYKHPIPKVVFVGFASCFGCQINITNIEPYLVDILGQIDMRYWQLTSSEPMPEDFDVAVIEGAITTKSAEETARAVRGIADSVITIGACAKTSGIPGIASRDYGKRANEVYGEDVPRIVAEDAYEPRSVSEVIDVDFEVPCCPIDPYDFVEVLQSALRGSNQYGRTQTLCGECKQNEKGCFYGRGVICMGLITQSGCGARCPSLGRPCNGCAGMSKDANIDVAYRVVERAGVDRDLFGEIVGIFNERDARIQEKARE